MVSEFFLPLSANKANVGPSTNATLNNSNSSRPINQPNGASNLCQPRNNSDEFNPGYFNHNMPIRLNDHNFLLWKQLVLAPIRGNSGEQKHSIGEVPLHIYAEKVNLQTRFLVIDSPLGYKAILGHPWIHVMKVVPDKQASAWQLQHPTSSSVPREPEMEELNDVCINKDFPDDIVQIGSKLTLEFCVQLNKFLKKYHHIFVWSHEDMTGIDPNIIVHKLQEKTEFVTERGTFCCKVMPFGLKNAGAMYQRRVNWMFADMFGDTMEVYIDDMKTKHFIWIEECQNALDELKAYLSSPPLMVKSKDRETLYNCLTVLAAAVSTVLVREVNGKQQPVYYVSKTLLDAETKYSQLEKLSLALITERRKLRPYFQCHPIVVLTKYPLRSILHKLELSGRL
uniref:Reverse transcriptase/retrotransposon-derived protein RNase H-like domain-containing protein n=1 Tax=Cannabis sativa TaxID=3483 RepID=A0A803PQG2_CANSA